MGADRSLIRRLGAICLLAAALAVGAIGPAPREARAETRISIDEGRDLAGRLLAMGRPREALMIVDGILQGLPEDGPALILRARALRDLGRLDEAEAAAAAARKAADTDSDRFFAALVTAQAKASDGKRGIAQYWLRHAAQIAPDDRLKAVAVRDFRAVRRRNPWRMSIDLYAAPSDNLDGSPPEGVVPVTPFLSMVNPKPPSGLRYGAAARLRYTIPMGVDARLHLDGFGGGSRVDLSGESRAAGIDAGDLSTGFLGVGGQAQWRGPDSRWLAHLGLSVTRQWEGGDLIADVGRVEAGYRWTPGEGLEAGIVAGGQRQFRHDTTQDVDETDIALQLSKRFQRGVLGFQLKGARTEAQPAVLDDQSLGAVLSYGVTRPVRGLLPRLSLGYEETWYDTAPLLFAGPARHDTEWSVTLDVLLPKMDYMGFAPEIGVSFRDRRSNYQHKSTQSTDLRLGLKSVF